MCCEGATSRIARTHRELRSLEEYLDMYRVASSEPAVQILHALDDEEKRSAKELAK